MSFKNDITKGYSPEINKEILSKLRVNNVLASLIEKIKQLPVINNRSEIFEELKELFSKKKWYGFYALALPQVEGIFSEMVKIVNPSKIAKASLTDKVNLIRSFYNNSDFGFDYYEFYLPNQRNKRLSKE